MVALSDAYRYVSHDEAGIAKAVPRQDCVQADH
jgi:hypothetical protein